MSRRALSIDQKIEKAEALVASTKAKYDNLNFFKNITSHGYKHKASFRQIGNPFVNESFVYTPQVQYF